MKGFQKYRLLIAIITIVIDGFILTPVAVWHSHAHHSENDQTHHSGTNETHHSCSICDHAYTPYILTPELHLNATPVSFLCYQQSCTQSTAVNTILHYNTRGSPTH